MGTNSTQSLALEKLSEQLRRLEHARKPAGAWFSGGCPALDRVLAGHGFHRGTLVEYLAEPGGGAAALALIAAREACREGGALVVIDRQGSLYPPATANLGIDLNPIFVRPRTQKDQLWALHQSLSCPGVGAVLCWPEKLDDRAFRAVQLAAENGATVGLFVRPISVRGQPTWSELQLLIETLPSNGPRRLRINVLRCRNGKAGNSVELELDDEMGTLQESRLVSMAPPVALAAGANRAARA